jgi:hypothetical protein
MTPNYLTLSEASQILSKRLERTITERQVLAYGENNKISIFSKIKGSAKFIRVDPIEGEQNEFIAIDGCLPRLSSSAVTSLLLTGQAQYIEHTNYKEVDYFGEKINTLIATYVIAKGEVPPQTTIEDCRISQASIDQIIEDDLCALLQWWEGKIVDYSYWLKLDILTAYEAVMLLNIVHPQRPLNTFANTITIEKITSEIRSAERAQKSGKLPENASPLDWLNWAISKSLDIPTQFNEFIDSNKLTVNPAKEIKHSDLTLNKTTDDLKASLEEALEKEPYGLSINNGTYTFKNADGSEEWTNEYVDYERKKFEFNERLKRGRYTLNDAALTLVKEATVSAEDMVKKLVQSAGDGTLKMYHPINDSRYLYGEKFNPYVTDYIEVTTYEELNQWLNAFEPLIKWRFPEPQIFENSTLDTIKKIEFTETIKTSYEINEEISLLFDGVSYSALETMFPSDGKWSKWVAKAKEKGLGTARVSRGKYNPYLAALWWMDKQSPTGWDWGRCFRKLANNLPRRSIDKKYLLTGEIE